MKIKTLSLRRIKDISDCEEAIRMYEKYYAGRRSVKLTEIAKKCATEYHRGNRDARVVLSWLQSNNLFSLEAFISGYVSGGGGWYDLCSLLGNKYMSTELLAVYPEKEAKRMIYRAFRVDSINATDTLNRVNRFLKQTNKITDWSWDENSTRITAKKKNGVWDLMIVAEISYEYPHHNNLVLTDDYQDKYPYIKIKNPNGRRWDESYIYFYNTYYSYNDAKLNDIRDWLRADYAEYKKLVDGDTEERNIYVTASTADLQMGNSSYLLAVCGNNTMDDIFNAVQDYEMVEEAIGSADEKLKQLASILDR